MRRHRGSRAHNQRWAELKSREAGVMPNKPDQAPDDFTVVTSRPHVSQLRACYVEASTRVKVTTADPSRPVDEVAALLARVSWEALG